VKTAVIRSAFAAITSPKYNCSRGHSLDTHA